MNAEPIRIEKMILTFLLLILTLSIALLSYLRWNFNYWKKRSIAGPKPRLFSGTFPKTFAGKCNLVEELHQIYIQYKSLHKCVGVYSARSPKLFILDPKLAAEVLIQNFSSFHDNESSLWTSPRVEQLRLCSPFVSKGAQWKDRRSEIVSALTIKRLRSFDSTFHDNAAKLVKYIDQIGEDKHIDAKELAQQFTAELMGHFIWGIEAGAFNGSTPIQQMANSMISQSLKCVRYYGRTAAFPWLRKLRPVRFFPESSDDFFKDLAKKVMHMRMTALSQRCDVIDHLMQLNKKKQLHQTEIAGHTTTVLIDGFETGAILIAHCLLLLARNVRVQQRLRAELSSLGGKALSFDVINELQYLDQCIQETLRLFPPLPTLFKLCTKAIEIDVRDDLKLRVNENDVVYISSYSFHRDAEFYDKPDEFWPERFDEHLGGVRKYREIGVFLPFGDGPRICPGMKLGLIEAKIAVAAIVQHFEITSSPRTRTDNVVAAESFLLSIEGGIHLCFKKLQNDETTKSG